MPRQGHLDWLKGIWTIHHDIIWTKMKIKLGKQKGKRKRKVKHYEIRDAGEYLAHSAYEDWITSSAIAEDSKTYTHM